MREWRLRARDEGVETEQGMREWRLRARDEGVETESKG